mmetsp:Transcript_60077/g.166292  ORF Transcript_60077/g.166292 Transcript_60077/m.166292 type:complete len:178 (-) Transcript_60077:335-868(-)
MYSVVVVAVAVAVVEGCAGGAVPMREASVVTTAGTGLGLGLPVAAWLGCRNVVAGEAVVFATAVVVVSAAVVGAVVTAVVVAVVAVSEVEAVRVVVLLVAVLVLASDVRVLVVVVLVVNVVVAVAVAVADVVVVLVVGHSAGPARNGMGKGWSSAEASSRWQTMLTWSNEKYLQPAC